MSYEYRGTARCVLKIHVSSKPFPVQQQAEIDVISLPPVLVDSKLQADGLRKACSLLESAGMPTSSFGLLHSALFPGAPR